MSGQYLDPYFGARGLPPGDDEGPCEAFTLTWTVRDAQLRVAMGLAERALDRILTAAQRRYEESLLTQGAPVEMLADLLTVWAAEAQAWRSEALARLRAEVRTNLAKGA